MPEIQMPKLSDTMTEGTVVAWKKKKGDKVAAGDVIAEIETDKATMEWESPEDGVLTEIFVEEGGKVNVGDKIAFIGAEGEAAPAQAKKRRKRESPGGNRETGTGTEAGARNRSATRQKRQRNLPTQSAGSPAKEAQPGSQ